MVTKEQNTYPTKRRPDHYTKKHFKHLNFRYLITAQNTNMKSQDNIYPPEANNSTATEPEKKSNLAEAQDKNSNIAIMNKFKSLKDEMNQFLNED